MGWLHAINTAIETLMVSSWNYLVVFWVALIDAFFPVVPSETVVIASGVAAAAGEQQLALIILLAAMGAFLGDHVSYAIGRFLGTRAVDRLLRGARGRAARARAERLLLSRGGLIIIALRFIPGGRTATTLTAGTLRYPLYRFSSFDAVAAVAWACYASFIGYFTGGAFKGNYLLAIAAGVGISVAVTVLVESTRLIIRRIRARRVLDPSTSSGDDTTGRTEVRASARNR